jgi:hypothetical protein
MNVKKNNNNNNKNRSSVPFLHRIHVYLSLLSSQSLSPPKYCPCQAKNEPSAMQNILLVWPRKTPRGTSWDTFSLTRLEENLRIVGFSAIREREREGVECSYLQKQIQRKEREAFA